MSTPPSSSGADPQPGLTPASQSSARGNARRGAAAGGGAARGAAFQAPSSSGAVPAPAYTPNSNSQVARTPLSVEPTPRSAGVRPHPPRRGDLGGSSQQHIMLTPLTSASDASHTDIRAEIWGTTVNVQQAQDAFHKFFTEFPDEHGNPLYPALLQECLDNSSTTLCLNLGNLFAHSPNLYQQLVIYPSDLIPIFDVVIAEERERLANPQNDPDISIELARQAAVQVRPFNLVSKKNMRELNPEDMDTLVSIKGMVIRVGGIVPEMQRAFFACSLCDHTHEVPIDEGIIPEPVQCAHCQSRHTYSLVHNRCRFNDKQLLKIQETPDSIPEGETPHSIKVFAFDELVDHVKPGDRVEITGIYKAAAARLNPRRSQLSTVYKTYVDAVHFKKTDNARMANEANDGPSASVTGGTNLAADAAAQARSNPNFFDEHDATLEQTRELEDKIRLLSTSPDIYDRLTRSLAPSIWELEDVKKGILCLLFGGSGAEQGASSGKFRGEINVLMCGDPGTSKSQLLQYVHKLAPRGIYTSGKGSSAVGLTASVVKDAETKEMVLESGALVLSDRGVCCIDEFDKMSDATRSILHEVMEQQTVSIAKAGIVCTLNARTSILASANPKESRYNPKLSVVENVQIMPTLLSRFDLIYLVLDQPNESKDRKLAKHLVGLYHEELDRGAAGLDVIPMDLLTSYISYARRTVKPVLSVAAEERLVELYVGMRTQGSNQKVITATPRQLEALIRLSEALAKMELKEEAATDPTTGRIDMDLLQTGHSSADRQQVDQMTDALRSVLNELPGKTIRSSALFEAFNTAILQSSGSRVSMERFKEVLHLLVTDNVVRMGQNNLVIKNQ